MPDYLDLEDVLWVHHDVHGCKDIDCVRDLGLIESAAARPQTWAFGQEAYPDIWEKAAAFLHSLTCNHPFLDGNKRTAWRCAWNFLGINGYRLRPDFDVDKAEKFMLRMDNQTEVADIAETLRTFAQR